MIRDLVINPGKICKETLKTDHYSYRQPLRQSFTVIEDVMLIFREPIQGSTSYTRLQIVSRGLYDIIFIAFHSNPIGGHLNAYRTFHQLHLRYHWALISIVVFARHSLPLSTCPCYQRICHTIAAHVWSRLHLLKSRTPIPITASLFSLKCWRRIAMACPTCRSTRLHLAKLALSPHRTAMRRPITNFRVMCNRCCASAGLSTPLAVVILRPPYQRAPFHSV